MGGFRRWYKLYINDNNKYGISMDNSDKNMLNELFSGQKFMQNGWAPEQERNFDNQTMPERDQMVMKGYEVIDGKTYKVWQA